MIQKGIDPKITQIVVLTTATIIIWVGIDIYRAFTKTTAPDVTQEQTAVLNPQIDLEFMKKLESRESPTEEDLEKIPLVPKLNQVIKETVKPSEAVSTASAQK